MSHEFINKYGYADPVLLAQDGAARRYYRVQGAQGSAVLMEVYGDTPGHRLDDFVRLNQFLSSRDVRVPQIIAQNGDYLLLEDFGDVSLKHALQDGGDAAVFYEKTIEVLDTMGRMEGVNALHLPDYFSSHVHAGHSKIVEIYLPKKTGQPCTPDLLQQYRGVWEEIERALPDHPVGFTHIDFHAENLMVLQDGQIGVLDFQGAMMGPRCYDLGNLLEDPRQKIPADLRARLLSGYDADFLAHYRVRTTQFHCRLLGQFYQMAEARGKPEYLSRIPVLDRYMVQALQEPVLRPLQAFLESINLDFS